MLVKIEKQKLRQRTMQNLSDKTRSEPLRRATKVLNGTTSPKEPLRPDLTVFTAHLATLVTQDHNPPHIHFEMDDKVREIVLTAIQRG